MKRLKITFLITALCLLTACSPDAGGVADGQPPAWHTISHAEAQQLMDETDDYILLDVRTEEEFNEGTIKGAILIPGSELRDRAEAELPDKDAVILVFCRSGRRSAAAAELLASLGYTNVYDIGGIIGWPQELLSNP